MQQARPLRRYTNEAAGAFVIITVVLFALALAQSGRLRDWFDPGVTLRVLLPEEGLLGLADGATVDILGTPAGQVKSIVIDSDKALHADVNIRSEMIEFVRKDSEAIIRKRFGVAGDSYLELTRGTGEPLDWNFAVLEASADRAPTEVLTEVVEELRNRVLPALDSVESTVLALAEIAEAMRDPQGDFRATLAAVRTITTRVERGEGAVGQLLGDNTIVSGLEELVATASGSAAQLSLLLSSTQARIGQVEPILTDLQTSSRAVAALGVSLRQRTESLPAITERAQSVLDSLDKVLRDVRRTTPDLPRIARGLAETTEGLPALLLQTQQTAAELERLVDQLRTSWLIGGGGGGAEAGAKATRRLSPLEVSP